MFLEQEDGETKENKYVESINKQKEGKCTNHPTDVKKKALICQRSMIFHG